jgi:hypothetical protein
MSKKKWGTIGSPKSPRRRAWLASIRRKAKAHRRRRR